VSVKTETGTECLVTLEHFCRIKLSSSQSQTDSKLHVIPESNTTFQEQTHTQSWCNKSSGPERSLPVCRTDTIRGVWSSCAI